MTSVLTFIRRIIGIRREINEMGRIFTKEVTKFQENANKVQQLTINHDVEWFQTFKSNSNGECK